jgi:hypothetical protein
LKAGTQVILILKAGIQCLILKTTHVTLTEGRDTKHPDFEGRTYVILILKGGTHIILSEGREGTCHPSYVGGRDTRHPD